MRIVAILNQKGGVGKTTTAVNLGAALARSGHRVLLVDCDSQANLTDHLGVDAQAAGSSIYDVLTEGAPVAEAVAATSTEGLFVLPADEDLAAAEQELAGEMAREFRLKRALGALDSGVYDWVLIDCPPSLGLLSLNAMAAAHELLITVQTEYFAMRGLGQIDQVIAMVREHVNRDLRILGILPTLVNPVTRLAREVLEEVRGHYGALVFETRIRQNVRLAEAPGHQLHIFDYDPQSAGAEDYGTLSREIEARVAHGEAQADLDAGADPEAEADVPADVDVPAEEDPRTQGEPDAAEAQAPEPQAVAQPTPDVPETAAEPPAPPTPVVQPVHPPGPERT